MRAWSSGNVAPLNHLHCNCNYILFIKWPWPGNSEGTFRSSSQAATCPPVYHTRRKLHTVPLIAERQEWKLWIPIFVVFGLTRPGTETKSTASVADALSTRPLIGWHTEPGREEWSFLHHSKSGKPVTTIMRHRYGSRCSGVWFITQQLNVCNWNNFNCNYILFTKLPWPGDSEGNFRSTSRAATCPPIYHTRWTLHTVLLIADVKQENCE